MRDDLKKRAEELLDQIITEEAVFPLYREMEHHKLVQRILREVVEHIGNEIADNFSHLSYAHVGNPKRRYH